MDADGPFLVRKRQAGRPDPAEPRGAMRLPLHLGGAAVLPLRVGIDGLVAMGTLVATLSREPGALS